jgi:hypothetical protein
MRTNGVREYLEGIIRQWLPKGRPKEGQADGPEERNWEEVG